jgi:hypothetical protein
MSLFNTPKHTVEVSDPKEAKKALEAAETLGLELTDANVLGWWKYDDDCTIADHADCQIDNIGRKWFYLEVAGNVVKCKPRRCPGEFSGDDGTLRLNFD